MRANLSRRALEKQPPSPPFHIPTSHLETKEQSARKLAHANET